MVAKNSSYKLTDAEINASFSENALKMMRKRFLFKKNDGSQETPTEMMHRISKALSEVERDYGGSDEFIHKTEKDFFEVMARKEFTPAGRTITNAGAPTALVANCIVLPISDNMDSIFQTLKDAALLQQAGSGLGFAFSELRPAGMPTKRSRGVSSGPLSFLEVYNQAFGVIKQQGRHGANMAIFRVDHPDICDFINCKKIEGRIRNFNISVGITDEFMEAVINRPNELWLTVWNGKKMKPHKVIRAQNGSVTGYEEIDITAKELFDLIIDAAWTNGEPGTFFIDTANRANPLPRFSDIKATNPCVAGSTLVATEKGLVPIKQLAQEYANGGICLHTDSRVPKAVATAIGNETISVITSTLQQSKEGAALMSRAWSTGVKPVYKLETKSGYGLIATADHKIITTEGKIEMYKLTRNHGILIQQCEGFFNQTLRLPIDVRNEIRGKNGREYYFNLPREWSRELGQVLGWLVGDGWLRDKQKEHMTGFVFAESDKEIMTNLKLVLNNWYGSERNEIKRENGVYHLMYRSQHFVSFFKSLGIKPVKAGQKEVPETLFTAPRDAVIGFLQGLFSADGTIANDVKKGSRYIRLTSKSRRLLQQTQILLLNLGIKSVIYDRSRPARDIFEYKNKRGERYSYHNDGVLYELQVSKQNVPMFIEKIGFIGAKFEDKINQLGNYSYYKTVFVERIKEITYLGEEEVFDLSEPLTTSFIANGLVVSNCGEQPLGDYDVCNLGSINLAVFAKDGDVDWNRLSFVTEKAVQMLDNVIDRSNFPVPKVTETMKGNRRVGLGVMGFADLLYQLKIKYNSAEGFAIAEKLMAFIQKSSEKASENLAEKKGIFPNYKLSVFYDKGLKRRNAALTTVAPTGSISMMFDTSSGIEPNFALLYTKQDKDGHQYHYLNKYFRQALEEKGIELEKVKDELMKTGGIQHLDWLPKDLRDTFVVSMDMSAEAHIGIQAAFQKNVDTSISKTINFPNSATREDVAKGYILAWKSGCKGCTVYREGSRTVQILNLGNGENIISPTELGEGMEKATVKALERLVKETPKFSPKPRPEVLTGQTYKVKTGYGNLYVTINNDENSEPFEIFATIGKSGGFFQEQSEGICRLISLALRAGVSVDDIIKDLKGIRGPMPIMTNKGTVLSLPDAIGQILDEHMKYLRGEIPKLGEAKTETLEEHMNREVPVAVAAASDFQKKKSIADFGMMPGCPECGNLLEMSEGCMSCKACGFSRCI